MSDKFDYDVFLSHSSKDKPIVHELAERLKADGLRVWLDEWIIKPGDPISLKIQHGIEKSRTLVMCMSPNFFASEWAKLEHHSLLFRDPTNEKRRFIPLLIADCEPPDMIAQFAHIDWRDKNEEKYQELLNACRANEETVPKSPKTKNESTQTKEITTNQPQKKQIKKPEEKKRLVLKGHSKDVYAVAVTPDGKQIVSGSKDKTLRVWDLASGQCQATLKDHSASVKAVAVTPDGKQIVSGSDDATLRVWDLASGQCLTTLGGFYSLVFAVAITPDGKQLVSGFYNNTLRVWDLASGRCVATLEGHSDRVNAVAVTSDGKQIVSGSNDNTLRVWDLASGRCVATLEGHYGFVKAVAITPDGKQIVSGSWDKTLRAWDLASGQCLTTLEEHSNYINAVAITPDGKQIVSGSDDDSLRVWDFPVLETSLSNPLSVPLLSDSKLYTNAKVALIGESGVGKTGLAIRLVEDRWEKTDSTHGMNVWQLPLSDLDTMEIEREVWLWDFAGQPDYRLIHQLFMDETALAVMVIDPLTDEPFKPLAHWEKALSVAVKNAPTKLLVAGRCERGGVTISQAKLDQYCAEHGYDYFLNTSAKAGDGCAELKEAIAKYIPWERLPWTSTSKLFKTLKDAILRIKQEDIALIRFAELRQRLQMELQQETIEEAKLRAVVGLLGGQGLIKPLDFGDFILLRPEEINNYASVVVRCARESSDDIGCVTERDVLAANIPFPEDMKRLKSSDEEILLRAIIETFINRSLCIREDTAYGTQLVFPSYFKQERDEIKDHPNVFVTYGFTGMLDEIYSTLVVRLHYTNDFVKDQLWKYAADFKTHDKKRVGLQMHKKNEGEAEIKVYFEAGVDVNTQVSFIKYIHEHLLNRAKDVTRVRSYVCTNPKCGEPLENRKAIKARIDKGLKDITCGFCDKRVMLIDMIEEKFASDEFRRTVQKMDEQAQINLDNESLELILVGHAFTIAGEAGHIFRPTPNSDWGIDGEIEFKNNEGKASGQRVYLQLKSGDSYLHTRRRDEKEIFAIKNPRHAEYWQAHQYPVMLVVRTSDGRIRWMNVTEYLQKHGADTKQITFDGEPFTALNVSRMRDKLLEIK
ncbi:MAG TPA: TIR domain-containing protein [Pyrinomonadaceae bacterium]